MASKRAQKRKRCGHKTPYGTKESAASAAYNLNRQAVPGNKVMDAYRCTVCGHWHVGHRPKRVQQAINSRRSYQATKGVQ